MIKRIKYIFLLPVLLAGMAGFTPPANDPCIEQVKNVYKKVQEVSFSYMNSEKVYYMDYTVRTATADSAQDGINESEIQMLACKKCLFVKSSQMEVYEDGDDAFVVLPDKKMVLRADADMLNDKRMKNSSMKVNMIQDTLFKFSSVSACGNTLQGGKRILLNVNEKGQELLGIQSVLFVTNNSGEYFDKIRINYTAGGSHLPGGVVYIEYNFKKVSYDYKGGEPYKNVSKLFMSGSELNGKYAGYKLIDSRKKKNPEPRLKK